MKSAPERRHWVLVAACAIQAFLMASLGLALASGFQAQPVHVAPAVAPAVVPPPATAGIPATTVYPVRLSLRVKIAGGHYPVELPTGDWVNPPLAKVPVGEAEPVDVTVTSAGPASVSDVWFGILPDNTLHNQPTQTGTPFCCGFSWRSKASQLPPGTRTFRFTVPAADLQPGSLPVIVMFAPDGSDQPSFAIVQLDTSG
jgi:hypothetical protein